MKKLGILMVSLLLLMSCGTTTSEDIQMLQTKYSTVYNMYDGNFIVMDSIHTYHVKVTGDGNIRSIVKIK